MWDVGLVEERFRKRLALWKRRYISKGRMLTLLRSTISGLPIYFISLFRLPRKVLLRGGGGGVGSHISLSGQLLALEKRRVGS